MNPDRSSLLHDVADAVAAAFAEVRDFGPRVTATENARSG